MPRRALWLLLVLVVTIWAGAGCAPCGREPPEFSISWDRRLEGVPCLTFYTTEEIPLFGGRTAVIEVDPEIGMPFHLTLRNHTGRDLLVAPYGDERGMEGIQWEQRTVSKRFAPETEHEPYVYGGDVWRSGMWSPPSLELYRYLPAVPEGEEENLDYWHWMHKVEGAIPLRGFLPNWDYADLTIIGHVRYWVLGYAEAVSIKVRRCSRLFNEGMTEGGKIRMRVAPLDQLDDASGDAKQTGTKDERSAPKPSSK